MGTLYADLNDSGRSVQPGGALVRVSGDPGNPVISALLKLRAARPEKLKGSIQVIPTDGKKLRITKAPRFRQPYRQALDDLSQFLQDNGCEAASKYLDCIFEL